LYYCSDLWEKSTVVSWAKRFTTWLDQFLKSPQMPIASVELMSKDELSELIQLESGKLIAGHLEKTVIELFDQQAHNRLSSIALSDGNHSMTYEELRVRSCQIAFCLLERGITVGSRVAVLMDRSFDSIATLLGIWKAGGVYLPLDPSYPKGRLKYFIQDAQPLALICTKELIGTIDFPTERTLVLEPQTKLSCRENLEEIAFPRVGLEDQAYLLYTSGSTGEPKGVQMPHRTLANLIGWQKTQERLSSAAKTLQFAPRCFDVSLQEIASTLTVGGTLVLIDGSQRLDPHALVDFIETNHIERVFLPYVMIDALVAVASPRQLTRLRDIVSAGESLRLSSRLRDFLSTHPDCILHNHYGPTETHVVTESMIQLDSFDLASEAHIGRPLPNCTCVILDENRKRVHRGAIGELFISGACLATGYANKPQMTTERFTIRNDLGGFDSTWYRTGDLARWRYDGNLDFLGRGDHQVKLRGFRIELGEIESNLASHPAIAQSVVILREDRPGDKRLVAYYTASGEILPSIAQLREHLETSLPEYMIPSAFVHLDALPLTPSGKIDRRGLPAPDLNDIDAQDKYTPARNGIEEQLVEIWQEILGMERIGVHDNFFALGGHSLLAVRLFNTINQRFQKNLPLSLVFQRGSIAQLALSLEETSDESTIARIINLRRGDSGPTLIVMPGLNGQLLYALKLVERLERRFDICGLEPNLSSEYLETYSDFRRLANEYLKIILKHQPSGPYNFVGYSYGGILGYEIACQLQDLGHRVDFVGVIDTGPDSESSSKDFHSIANHWMKVAGNLPSWIKANCGPENLQETIKKGSRRLRYWTRRYITRGKTEYRFEDEFGNRRSHDDRREILGRIFQSFNGYQPESYAGRVTLFRASVRPLLHSLSPDLGWSSVAQEVVVYRIPGDHNTILESAGIDLISDLISSSEDFFKDA
ncbi:MAG: non-ribosomal peptide synthetase, partial [Planctomycetota bacterium]